MAKQDSQHLPSPDFHTPEELLATAIRLLRQEDPSLNRAVLLESIAALETAVERTVFPLLKETLGPVLANWLKDKTKMDFDSRLTPLAGQAIKKEIDTRTNPLWKDYKKVKQLRNQAIHRGTRVSRENAAFAIKTVESWLAFLGSTAQIEVALWMIKHYFERREPYSEVPSRSDLVSMVSRVFTKAKVKSVQEEPTIKQHGMVLRPDLVVTYGDIDVVVETKVIKNQPIGSMIDMTAMKALSYAGEHGRAAILFFSMSGLPSQYDGVFHASDGRVSAVGIRVPTKESS